MGVCLSRDHRHDATTAERYEWYDERLSIVRMMVLWKHPSSMALGSEELAFTGWCMCAVLGTALEIHRIAAGVFKVSFMNDAFVTHRVLDLCTILYLRQFELRY